MTDQTPARMRAQLLNFATFRLASRQGLIVKRAVEEAVEQVSDTTQEEQDLLNRLNKTLDKIYQYEVSAEVDIRRYQKLIMERTKK